MIHRGEMGEVRRLPGCQNGAAHLQQRLQRTRDCSRRAAEISCDGCDGAGYDERWRTGISSSDGKPPSLSDCSIREDRACRTDCRIRERQSRQGFERADLRGEIVGERNVRVHGQDTGSAPLVAERLVFCPLAKITRRHLRHPINTAFHTSMASVLGEH